jgi:type IV pilus assembly protein PilO
MTRGHADRMWAVGGAVGAAVLVALAWFFLISPQRAETAVLQEDTAAAHTRIGMLQQRLGQLRKENSELAKFQAQLAADRQALPTDSGLPNFLRQIQIAGEATGVTVNSVTVGEPDVAAASGGQLYAFTITMTVEGNAATLSRYLDQLQRVQPRAVLINSVNLAAADPSTSINSPSGLTLNLHVFVATPPGAKAPAPNTEHTTSEGTN